ncbi:MAG: hypothetical protein CSA22_00345 [Deltaproteobacteria bacterium]|nr:MAG: hypothetical protein CSA22_00345 [Deltaproteobacteria bacterium]
MSFSPGTPHDTKTRKVLLIGWDGADWNVINPLMDTGKMPHLERLVNQGVMGNISTLYPELSPMLWTSIATGKRAYKHGIYGFIEPMPNGDGIRPITNLSRKTKAIWNILSQEGKKCHVIGWWPSHPAEPINGVMVSNQYQRAHAPLDQPWPMKPGTVHPPRLINNLAALRWHPQNLEAGHILPFVPNAARVNQDRDRRLETIARIICDCSTVQAAALAIMHHEPWDFTAVYFDAIDHFSHGFMQYHPPRLSWIPPEDYDIYNTVVQSGYIYHDMMLGQLLAEAGDDTTVILLSDHGFLSDHRRSPHIPDEPAGPAAQHRHHGILVMKGPGIKQDEIIHGAVLLDICPTILSLFGLPVGEDMDGKPLAAAFTRSLDIQTLPSWDTRPGDAGTHPPETCLDPAECQEAIQQLVALGYIDEPDADKGRAVQECIRELNYNLARTYMDAGRHVDAILLLEKLAESWPDQYRFGLQLIGCYKAVDRIEDAQALLDTVIDRKEKKAAEAATALETLLGSLKDKQPADLTEKEQTDLRVLRQEAAFNTAVADYLRADLFFAGGDLKNALKYLTFSENKGYDTPPLHLLSGHTCLQLNQLDGAKAAFQRVLDLDPENASAHIGFSRVYLAEKKHALAADHAMTAAGLDYQLPAAHYLLGIALTRMNRIPRAIQALKVAVHQNPNHTDAYHALTDLYKNNVKNADMADRYAGLAREAEARIRHLKSGTLAPAVDHRRSQDSEPAVKDGVQHPPLLPGELEQTIVIVTGLPRSGTSMMMQMLAAGGLPVLTDDRRKADPGNPNGYFEYERVKQLAADNHWLEAATGQAVKVVVPLLDAIRNDLAYRVIFMERDLGELIRSQARMLERTGRKGSGLSDEQLAGVYHRQVRRSQKTLLKSATPLLCVSHRSCIDTPDAIVRQVNRFLGGSLDETAMMNAVDAGLYREKGSH